MIEVKIIGSDNSNGQKLKKFLKNIARSSKINISILEMNDKNNIRKYKVVKTPTLIINNEYIYNIENMSYNLLKKLVVFCS